MSKKRRAPATIKWSGLGPKDEPDCDLTVKRRDGRYDVVSGINGWVVLTPVFRWTHDGRDWSYNLHDAPPHRGMPGAVTREQARLFAESLILKPHTDEEVDVMDHEASLKSPLWVQLTGGKAAHAVIGPGLDTVCGLSPELASHAPKDLKRCTNCNARMKEYLLAEKEKRTAPSYSKRDPKGWCGDPKRGAALGRTPLHGEADYAGKIHLQRVYLDNGGYDRNGTYFGHGAPIYWYATSDETIDGTLRATSRDLAKADILKRYPNAKFFR
jgi:hypothetical protein